MIINPEFPQGINNIPQSFVSAVNYVVNLYDQLFTNANVTLNIDYLYGQAYNPSSPTGTIQYQPMANATPSVSYALGTNSWNSDGYSYGQILSQLTQDAQSSTQKNVWGNLPNSPYGNAYIALQTAQEKALGFTVAPNGGLNGTNLDGVVGIISDAELQAGGFTADWTTAPPANSNQFYMIGTIEHETSEVMGRYSYLGATINQSNGTTAQFYSLIDLFRYASPNGTTLDVTSGGTGSVAYFSLNGGSTDLATWNNDTSNGDLADWGPPGGGNAGGPGPLGNDSFNNHSYPGVVNGFTTTDLALMNVLGWDTSVPPNEIPNGVIGWVPPGQTSSGIIVDSGGKLVVGGVAKNTTVLNGGTIEVLGHSSTAGTKLDAGGFDQGADFAAGSGCVLSNKVVGSGLIEEVESGGRANGTTVDGAGLQIVDAGGVASGTVVLNGGVVWDYGTTHSAVVSAGGKAYVYSGGTASNTDDFGMLEVGSGLARNTTVESGGGLTVENGGVASGTIVRSGGTENLGTSYGVNGGRVVATVVSSGGFENVYSHGVASGTVLSGGVENVYSGGTASASVLGFLGTQNVYGGGTVVGTKFRAGTQNVLSGATVTHANVEDGVQNVLSGGATVGTTLSGGSLQVVSAGGVASGTVVEGYSVQSDQGTTVGTVLSSGMEYVYGTAKGTIIDAGGSVYVENGFVASGTVISGGTLEVLNGGALGGAKAATFAAGTGGDLKLQGGANISQDPIAGFGASDTIDLMGVSFGPNTTLGFTEAANQTSGTLTVSDGAHSASLLLLGQYSAANFAMASDQYFGGTMINYAPEQGTQMMMARSHG